MKNCEPSSSQQRVTFSFGAGGGGKDIFLRLPMLKTSVTPVHHR